MADVMNETYHEHHRKYRILASLSLMLGGPLLMGAAPLDYQGRPLRDEHGSVRYVWQDDAWLARHADGRTRSARGAVPTYTITSTTPAPSASAYSLAPYTSHHPGSWPEAVAIGDVTGDGLADVVMTTTRYFDPINDYHVFLYAQQPDGTLAAPAAYPYQATANRNGLVLGDLDGNGVLDVVVGHAGGISVLLADCAGGLEPANVVSDWDADTLAAMDINFDGHLDIISLGWSRGASIFYGDGTGDFFMIAPLATHASGYNDHEVEDLTGDGIPDLAVMSGQRYATPNLTVHRHDDSGDIAVSSSHFMGVNELGHGLGLGDVTGDGRPDAVLSRGRNSPTHLWIMAQNGVGGLTGPTTIATHDVPESVEVADLDGNGLEDIVVVHGGWMQVGVYLHEPDTGLTHEVLYPIPYASHYAPQGLAIGDFSNDGCGDVAIADYNHGLVTLLGQCAADTTDPVLLK